MLQTTTYEEIAIAPSVRTLLDGAKVLGARLRLQSSRPALDLWNDWARLHEIWRGKSRKEVEQDARVQAYRSFYTLLGLDPNRTPPSVQGLVQRFLRGDVLAKIPAINPIVDAVNLAAVETMVPLGVFDASRVSGAIVIDLSKGGEHFHAIGADAAINLDAGLVVLRDDEKVLSQFCHRDAEAQKVSNSTESVWLLGCQVPGVSTSDVTSALSRAIEVLSRQFDVS